MSNELKSNGLKAIDRVEIFKQEAESNEVIVPTPLLSWLLSRNYFISPASTKYHGAYPGGLFDHSLNVTSYLKDLTKRLELEWERPQSPFIIGMFHDLCKIDSYILESSFSGSNEAEPWYRYRHNALAPLKGHGDKSIILLSQFMTLTPEEIMCIRYHMGAFVDQKEWGDFTNAIHNYPNVLYTHTADMMAAHIKEVD